MRGEAALVPRYKTRNIFPEIITMQLLTLSIDIQNLHVDYRTSSSENHCHVQPIVQTTSYSYAVEMKRKQ